MSGNIWLEQFSAPSFIAPSDLAAVVRGRGVCEPRHEGPRRRLAGRGRSVGAGVVAARGWRAREACEVGRGGGSAGRGGAGGGVGGRRRRRRGHGRWCGRPRWWAGGRRRWCRRDGRRVAAAPPADRRERAAARQARAADLRARRADQRARRVDQRARRAAQRARAVVLPGWGAAAAARRAPPVDQRAPAADQQARAAASRAWAVAAAACARHGRRGRVARTRARWAACSIVR